MLPFDDVADVGEAARLRAVAVDALGQRSDWRDRLEAEIVGPLEAEADARRRTIAARAAATKVDFFTVAREANS